MDTKEYKKVATVNLSIREANTICDCLMSSTRFRSTEDLRLCNFLHKKISEAFVIKEEEKE
jgi:hypothetical protein